MRVFSAVSGEEVCRGFEFEGKVAKELKHSLTAQTGYSRFRQRLLKNDHRQIEDDEVLDAESLQLVFLEFCPSSAEQERELLDACENSDLDKLERLLRQPLNPNGNTMPLHAVAKGGSLDCARLLLEARAEIDKLAEGRRPLHLASNHGHVEILRLLLEAQAMIDATTETGETPLYLAVRGGNFETTRVLVDSRADINLFSQVEGDIIGPTALHLAAFEGCEEIVGLLLQAGADQDLGMDNGETALHVAAAGGSTEAVGMLIEAKAYVDQVSENGRTALHFAAEFGQVKVINHLLHARAEVNHISQDGSTALHWAAGAGSVATVHCLLEAGAKSIPTSENFTTPFDWAQQIGQEEIMRILK